MSFSPYKNAFFQNSVSFVFVFPFSPGFSGPAPVLPKTQRTHKREVALNLSSRKKSCKTNVNKINTIFVEIFAPLLMSTIRWGMKKRTASGLFVCDKTARASEEVATNAKIA